VAGLRAVELSHWPHTPKEGGRGRSCLSDKMALLLRLLALSLLLAVATPIRDVTDACSSQVKGTYCSWP
jgi:hypothetical protein